MNPETTLVWHPLQEKLIELKQDCLRKQPLPIPHWERIENIAASGTPDLSWAWGDHEGFIELKHRHSPPVGVDTPVVIESVTAHQRLWWRQRWEAGGNISVLVRIGNEFLLFPGFWAAFNLGTSTMHSLREHASYATLRRELDVQKILSAAVRS